MGMSERSKLIWKNAIKFVIYWILFFIMATYIYMAGEINSRFFEMPEIIILLSMIVASIGILLVLFRNTVCYSFLSDPDRKEIPFQSILDEIDRRRYEVSGGIVLEIVLYDLVFIVCITALLNEVAFWISFIAFFSALIVKFILYIGSKEEYKL